MLLGIYAQCQLECHHYSSAHRLTSCLFPGMNISYILLVYTLLHSRKGFKSIKSLTIVQPPFLAHDPERLTLLLTIFDNLCLAQHM